MGKSSILQSQSDSNFSTLPKITSPNKRHELKSWTTYITVNTRALSEDVEEVENESDKENVDNTNTTNTATNSTSTPTTEENKE